MERDMNRPETMEPPGQAGIVEAAGEKAPKKNHKPGRRIKASQPTGSRFAKRGKGLAEGSGRLRRRLSRRELIILLIPTLAAVVAVLLVFRLADRGVHYQFAESGHQYYAGASITVAKGQDLFCGSDGIVRAGDNKNGEPVRVPIYLDESPAVVLPADMVYYDPRNSICARIPSLSEVRCDKDGNITITRGGEIVRPYRGFLYDGDNFYLFLESMEISFNGYKIEVPALSYVEAVFGGDIMVFNYDSKECIIERCDGAGNAEAPFGDYSISLLGDSMTYGEDQKTLLVSRPDVLDPIV